MTIEEMHVMFRELAQQMGMQTVRAILPEDIDICLNNAIVSLVKELITSNVGYLPYNDKVNRANSSIGSINGLRTLYNKANIYDDNINGEGTQIFPYTLNIISQGIMLYTGFKVSYDGKSLFDCRIIENENLSQTLNDFCNRATKDAPICTIVGNDTSIDVEIITGSKNSTKPKLVQYLYIAEPAKVYYDEDNIENNVNCNLHNYLHTDVVNKAVNIYLQSIGAIKVANKNND